MSRPASLRPVLAVMGVALLLALAACSSTPTAKSAAPAGPASPGTTGSAAKAPTGPPDACKLVTPAEAQTALGKPVRPAKAALVGPAESQGASCTYESTDFANGTAAGASLVITVFTHSSTSKSQWDQVYKGNGNQAVAGLADGAWFRGGMLNVFDKGSLLGVSIVSLQTEATVDQLVSLARLAVPRI